MSTLRVPWLKLCANQIEWFTADSTERPTVGRLLEQMKAPGRTADATDVVPADAIRERSVSFRMWTRDAPRLCDQCGGKKECFCYVLVPNLDEARTVDVRCGGCADTVGDLWVDINAFSELLIGEADTDVVYRTHDVMVESFASLMALYK